MRSGSARGADPGSSPAPSMGGSGISTARVWRPGAGRLVREGQPAPLTPPADRQMRFPSRSRRARARHSSWKQAPCLRADTRPSCLPRPARDGAPQRERGGSQSDKGGRGDVTRSQAGRSLSRAAAASQPLLETLRRSALCRCHSPMESTASYRLASRAWIARAATRLSISRRWVTTSFAKVSIVLAGTNQSTPRTSRSGLQAVRRRQHPILVLSAWEPPANEAEQIRALRGGPSWIRIGWEGDETAQGQVVTRAGRMRATSERQGRRKRGARSPSVCAIQTLSVRKRRPSYNASCMKSRH
jgi:hypothetical protein